MIVTMLVLQLLIDILLVSVILWMWWQDKNKVANVNFQPSTISSEHQVRDLQKEMEALQLRVDTQLKQLNLLFERTSRLLDQGGFSTGYLPASVEETELKAAVEMQKEKREIPSLEQLEVTKLRLKTESSYDLRTLLRGQLT